MATNLDKKSQRLAKYAGLAFQLMAFILVGYFLGDQVDKYFQSPQPYGVAAGSILFLIFGLIYVVKDVLREK